jgi:hypothetical protein
MRKFTTGLLVVFLGIGVGCDVLQSAAESPEEKLVRLKIERVETLDTLYAEYGGGELSNMAGKAASDLEVEAGSNAFVDMLAGAVGESDRAMFDANCDLIGAGERPTAFTSKAKDFFQTDTAKSRCIQAGRLGREITSLQAELSASAVEAP